MDVRRFVVEVFDPETECIARDIAFDVSRIEDLAAIVDIAGLGPGSGYELDDGEIARLNAAFGLGIESGTGWALLRARRELDDRPYKVHTCRELALMLAGTKPLAAFCGPYRPGEEVVE